MAFPAQAVFLFPVGSMPTLVMQNTHVAEAHECGPHDGLTRTPSTSSGEDDSEQFSSPRSCSNSSSRGGGSTPLEAQSPLPKAMCPHDQKQNVRDKQQQLVHPEKTAALGVALWKVKNTFIELVEEDFSLATAVVMRSKSAPNLLHDTEEEDEEEEEAGAIEIAGGSGGTNPPASLATSEGSRLHGTGMCRPCAWLWKVGGCKNGKDCRHCHSCPEGEIKRRRAVRLNTKRTSRRSVPLCH